MLKKMITLCLGFSFLNLQAQQMSKSERQIKAFPDSYAILQDKIKEIQEECEVIVYKGAQARSYYERNKQLLLTGTVAVGSIVTITGASFAYSYYSKKAINGQLGYRIKNSGKYANAKATARFFQGVGVVGLIGGTFLTYIYNNPGDSISASSVEKVTIEPEFLGARILVLNDMAVDSLLKSKLDQGAIILKLIDEANEKLKQCEEENKK